MARSFPPQLIDIFKRTFSNRFEQCDEIRAAHAPKLTWLKPEIPDAVLFAHSKEDVINAIKLCTHANIAIIPYGAGTSLEGQVNAPHGGLSINMSRMNAIKTISQDDLYAVIEPGVTRTMLNKSLKPYGLFFSVDPGSDATIGGMASTRASGTNTVRYGTIKDNVLALEVVLSSGETIKTGNLARKSACGYDLTPLFIGAEGTLGIITELTVRLHPIPAYSHSGRCSFPSIATATRAVISALSSGINPAKIELLDSLSIKACNLYSGLSLDETPTLFYELNGADMNEIENRNSRLACIMQENEGKGHVASMNPDDGHHIWEARRQAWWAIHNLYPGRVGVATDVCVPISKLAQCIAETERDIQLEGLDAPIIGHVGDGNFHSLIMLDIDDSEKSQKARELIARLNERAIACGGTCSGEHGIGQGKMKHLAIEHRTSISAMRSIKIALDPKCIMNPGKLFSLEDQPVN